MADKDLCESFQLAGEIYIIPVNVAMEIERLRRAREVTDEMVKRALQGFDTGTGDPNDYPRRMRAALEAAVAAPTRHLIGAIGMAIDSKPFGGVRLTGEDATAFLKWVNDGIPNPIAREACRRGVELAREFRKNGKVLFIIHCDEET